jgi:hypothetical protein
MSDPYDRAHESIRAAMADDKPPHPAPLPAHPLASVARLYACARQAYLDAGIPLDELDALAVDMDREMRAILDDARILAASGTSGDAHDAACRTTERLDAIDGETPTRPAPDAPTTARTGSAIRVLRDLYAVADDHGPDMVDDERATLVRARSLLKRAGVL